MIGLLVQPLERLGWFVDFAWQVVIGELGFVKSIFTADAAALRCGAATPWLRHGDLQVRRGVWNRSAVIRKL